MTQKNVREYQRAQCIALTKSGMSYRAIGTNVGTSRALVQRTLKIFEETGGFQQRWTGQLKSCPAPFRHRPAEIFFQRLFIYL
jgi:transposase